MTQGPDPAADRGVGEAGNGYGAGPDSGGARPEESPRGPASDTPGRSAEPGPAAPGPADVGADSDSQVRQLAEALAGLRAEAARTARVHRREALVDQAVGVVMARSGAGSAEALAQLAEIERRSGRTLAEVAGDVVAEAAGMDPGAGLAPEPDEAAAAARLRPEVAGLDRARGADELAGVLVREALAWSGPAAAAVALLDEDGCAEVVGEAGFAPREVRRWRRIPPALDCLVNRAVAARHPLWVDAASDAVPPLLGEHGSGAAALGTRLAAPVRLGRRLLGVVEVAWTTGTAFSARERREIEAVVGSVSTALLRADAGPAPAPRSADGAGASAWQDVVDVLDGPALVLAAAPYPRTRIVAVNRAAANVVAEDFAELSPAAAAPWLAVAGVLDRLAAVLATGVPFRLELPGRPGGVAGMSAARVGAEAVLVTCRVADSDSITPPRFQLERLARVGAWQWDVRADRARWSTEALRLIGSRAMPEDMPIGKPPYTVHPEDADIERRFVNTLTVDGKPAEAELRILHYNGEPLRMRLSAEPATGHDGRVTVVHGIVQDVTEWRRAETALEIARVQIAAQRTRADAERTLATMLQQIVVPASATRQPPASAVEAVARYRPTSANAGVGGDWYGVFPLRDARVLLSVGDVAGHGLPAASAMADLHHSLRGLALTGTGPGGLLTLLNELTCGMQEFTIASACCALWDPATRRLRWANAGHPRPVLVRGGSAALLDAPVGPMLGVDPAAEYAENELEMESGDVILLYTDGLVERRRGGDEEGMDFLLEQAGDPGPDLDEYADRILNGARSDTDDDICVLAVRFDGG